MDIVKKNMWSIVCGVVALLAVASTFYPLGGKFEELNTKLQTSADDFRKFKAINSQKLNMPVVDPKTTDVPKLDVFPTDKVIERGRQVIGKVKTESEKLQAKANEMNKRPQLVLGALPAGQNAHFANFKDAYYERLDELKKELNATTVPTEKEIREREDLVWKEEFEPLVRRIGDGTNEQEVKAQFELEKKEIPMIMRRERARNFTMYLNPERQGTSWGQTTSFDYDPIIPPPDARNLPGIVDVWGAQLGLWIQEDVVRAIVETNNAAAAALPQGTKLSVEDAIIKRLFRTQIKKAYITRTGEVLISTAANPMVGAGPGANQPAEDPAAQQGVPKVFAQSATGRVCNPTYDVMHFIIIVDADAHRFETFMTNLTKGKFITILRADVLGVDRERVQQNAHYYYGKNPVVRLTLKCEALFFRNWTVDAPNTLMPVNVQKILKIPQNPTGIASR
jgi:hypothetical protein